MFSDNDVERFFAKVNKTDGCWEWTAGKDSWGYGSFWWQGRNVGAHRWSYEYHNGAVPPGLQIDHLCRNRKCVRPDHLEAVDSETNMRRGNSPSVVIARTGVCKRGHPLTPDNVLTYGGRWHCRTCKNERNLRYMVTEYGPAHREQKREYDRARYLRMKGGV